MNNTQEYINSLSFTENIDKNSLYPFNNDETIEKIRTLLAIDTNEETLFFDELLSISNYQDLKNFLNNKEGVTLNKMYEDHEDKEGYYELIINGLSVYLIINNNIIVFIGNDLDNIKAIKELDHYWEGLNIKPYYRLDSIHVAHSLKYDENGNVEVNDEGDYINKIGIDSYEDRVKLGERFEYFHKITGKFLGEGIEKNGEYIYIEEDGERVKNKWIDIVGKNIRIPNSVVDISYDNEYELIKDSKGNYIYINILEDGFGKHDGYIRNKAGTYFLSYDKEFNFIGTGLIIKGEYKYFTDKGEKYNLLSGSKEFSDLAFHVNPETNTFKHEYIEISYNPETLEVLRDEHDRLILIDGDIFTVINLEKNNSIGGIVIDGKFTFLEGSNGFKYDFNGESENLYIYEKVCGREGDFPGLNIKENTVYFSKGCGSVKLSYNPKNGKILLDEYGNEVLEEGNTFFSYTGGNNYIYNKRSGLIIEGKYKSIKYNGKDIKGVQSINVDQNIVSFGNLNLSLIYNPSTLELIKDENGLFTGKEGNIFYKYKITESDLFKDSIQGNSGGNFGISRELAGRGIIINGEYIYIHSGNKEYKDFNINTDNNTITLGESKNEISFNPVNGEIITDDKGNYLYIKDNTYISYNKDSLSKTSDGVIIKNKFINNDGNYSIHNYATGNEFKKNTYNFVIENSDSLEDIKNRLRRFSSYEYSNEISNNPNDLILFIIDHINVETFNFEEIIDLYTENIKNGVDCQIGEIVVNCGMGGVIEKINYYKIPFKYKEDHDDRLDDF